MEGGANAPIFVVWATYLKICISVPLNLYRTIK